ncbi:hypothetical protein FPOA_07773 [Fusarium poae]|uniref:Uncharacterized protein n=1 Tax=Fusarium poae TaxID=36050 RepID=A0A1B8ALI5_FUSPO|nr:hypothetical protein FPOA_07773 [Fusarium poae]
MPKPQADICSRWEGLSEILAIGTASLDLGHQVLSMRTPMIRLKQPESQQSQDSFTSRPFDVEWTSFLAWYSKAATNGC